MTKTQNSKLKTQNLEKGFTLIELIIVIAIIGVLAGMIMFALNPVLQLQKARDGQRKADLRQIQSALEIYRSDIGNYPDVSTAQQVDSAAGLKNCPSSGTKTYFGNSNSPSCTRTYMQKIPTDPKNTGNYVYKYISTNDKATYSLFSCLENVNDPQRDTNSLGNYENNSIYCDGGTTNWSYTVSNP